MTKLNTTIEHIETIKNNIQSLIDKKEDFTAFIIIALGIEFLGCFYDNKPFDEKGQSENRFKKGVGLFNKSWYKQNQKWMYKHFRGPLVHQFWTGSEMVLTSYCKNNAPKEAHLKQDENNKRIFIVEEIFEDFKIAANNLKNQKSLNKNKQEMDFSKVGITSFDNKNFVSSGSTMTNETKIEIVSCDQIKEKKKEIRKRL